MASTSFADVNAVLNRLTVLLQDGAFADAANLAAGARLQYPVAAELVRLHGTALLQLGRFKEAQMALVRAAELAPESVETQCSLAAIALSGGRADGRRATCGSQRGLRPGLASHAAASGPLPGSRRRRTATRPRPASGSTGARSAAARALLRCRPRPDRAGAADAGPLPGSPRRMVAGRTPGPGQCAISLRGGPDTGADGRARNRRRCLRPRAAPGPELHPGAGPAG